MKLYVTDWAPNGTNDLIACDAVGNVVDVLEEATFGIDVCRCKQQFGVYCGQLCDASDDAADSVVAEIDVFTAYGSLAVSPVRSHDEALERLNQFIRRNKCV